jgi:hypothetical protein
MAKGATRTDVEHRIGHSEPTANRIGEASWLLAHVLLRHDARVQAAYDVWRARVIRYENAGQFTEDAARRSLVEDAVQLNALVRALGLERYQSWLPNMLHWEFHRALERGARVEVTIETGLAWLRRGKRPKRRPGATGGFRLEHLEQHVERFYFCEVQVPRTRKLELARLTGCSRADVQRSVKRVRLLLDCIVGDLSS